MTKAFPNSVRYIKNGEGGKWWKAAKANEQVHLGWRDIPDALLRAADMALIESMIRTAFGSKRGATQDFNALQTLLDHPSQHVWITFRMAACGGALFGMGSKQILISNRANGAISGLPVNCHGAIIPKTMNVIL
jgi:hypothetical protein